MTEKRQGELDATTEDRAKERVMLERLTDTAKAFYKNPKNLQAFEAWKKNKEEHTYGTSYVNA